MCLVVEAAKMSSSKVIKSSEHELQISSLNFRNITCGTPLTPHKQVEQTDGFTPMGIFDLSEVGEKCRFVTKPQEADEELQPPPPPPGNYVTDEELQRYQEESYQRGLQDGKNLAERGLLNVFRGLRTAAEELQALREKVLHDSEDDLLSLSLALARKVIAHEVMQDRMVVLRLVKAAVVDLNEQDELVIRIHPDDHAMLTTTRNETLQQELAAIRFVLKPDPSVQLGSCLIETALGTVDAGFEAQLDDLYRRLLESRTEPLAENSES